MSESTLAQKKSLSRQFRDLEPLTGPRTKRPPKWLEELPSSPPKRAKKRATSLPPQIHNEAEFLDSEISFWKAAIWRYIYNAIRPSARQFGARLKHKYSTPQLKDTAISSGRTGSVNE